MYIVLSHGSTDELRAMEELTNKIKEHYDTYSEFCESAGISIVELSQFMRGRIDIKASQFISIADTLHISLDELRRITVGVDGSKRLHEHMAATLKK